MVRAAFDLNITRSSLYFVVGRLRFSRFIWFATQLYLLLIVRCIFFQQFEARPFPGPKFDFASAAICVRTKVINFLDPTKVLMGRRSAICVRWKNNCEWGFLAARLTIVAANCEVGPLRFSNNPSCEGIARLRVVRGNLLIDV